MPRKPRSKLEKQLLETLKRLPSVSLTGKNLARRRRILVLKVHKGLGNTEIASIYEQ